MSKNQATQPGMATKRKGPPKAKVIAPDLPALSPPKQISPKMRITRANGKPRSRRGRIDGRLDRMKMEILKSTLLAGNTYSNACMLAGLRLSTFNRWMADGASAKEGTLSFNFWHMVKKASAEAEQRALMRIQKAGETSWQASAWFLERRNPAEWGARQRMEIASAEGSPIQRVEPVLQLSPEHLEKFFRRRYELHAEAEARGITFGMPPEVLPAPDLMAT